MHGGIDEAMHMRAGAAGMAHPRGEAVGLDFRESIIRHQLCTFGVSGRPAHSVQDPSYTAGSGKPALHQAERQDAGGHAGAAGGDDRAFRRRRPAAAKTRVQRVAGP